MLALHRLRVTSLDVDFHEVSWEVRDGASDLLDFAFSVLRSEAEEGPYDDLSGPLVDRYRFVDNVLQIQHRWRRYHYRIRVTERATGRSEDFGPVSADPEPDLVAMELRRHVRLLLHEFAGRRSVVLPRRTFGQRCECWDSVLEKRTRSGCLTCFDTGLVRGYLHPIETWIQTDPSPKTKQPQNTGTTQQSNTTMRLGYYPSVKPDDVIVEMENRRWRVVHQNQTEHSRAAVHQEVTVHEIHPKDIEFAIPVSFSEALPNLFFTPPRNFTNAHSLETFERNDLPGVLGLYRR